MPAEPTYVIPTTVSLYDLVLRSAEWREEEEEEERKKPEMSAQEKKNMVCVQQQQPFRHSQLLILVRP